MLAILKNLLYYNECNEARWSSGQDVALSRRKQRFDSATGCCFTKQKIKYYGSLVKRLRRRPLTAKTAVRFRYELLTVKTVRLL